MCSLRGQQTRKQKTKAGGEELTTRENSSDKLQRVSSVNQESCFLGCQGEKDYTLVDL